MKKKNLLLAAVGIASILGIVSCSSNSKSTPTPIPTSLITIARYPWQISSVTFKHSDGITDSLKYTSADSLNSSRIQFGANYAYAFGDKNNSTLLGPSNDTTLFRYGVGVWSFDQNWTNSAYTGGNVNAVPDSLLFVATDPSGAYAIGPVVHCKINQLDSLHLQISYLDSSILNKTTNTKYKIAKVVSFGAVTQ